MSLPTQEDAEKKFWRMPEMVERLLPFLDAVSTLSLVKALPLALELIQRKFLWRKLVRRVCPFDTDEVVSEAEFEEVVVKERSKVMPLVEIVKMMEDPNPRLLDLLHVICQRFPPVARDDVPEEARSRWSNGEIRVNEIPGPEFIELSCTCRHTRHAVCPFGFLLLEGVERAMGTTQQMVQWVVTDDLDGPLLAALNSRLLRQQDLGLDTKVDVSMLRCTSQESAEAISTLMKHCQSVNVRTTLFIESDIGIEGWTSLAGALSWKGVDHIDSYTVMANARKEDLKAIWECMTYNWVVWQDDERWQLFEDWNLFEEYLDGVESGTHQAEEHVNEN